MINITEFNSKAAMAAEKIALILDASSSSAEEMITQMSDRLSAQEKEALAAQVNHAETLCIECGDQPAVLTCKQCDDIFCEVCFASLHKHGKRQKHNTQPLRNTAPAFIAAIAPSESEQDQLAASASSLSEASTAAPATAADDAEAKLDEMLAAASSSSSSSSSIPAPLGAPAVDAEAWLERAKYIPLRLSLDDRKRMRLLESTMNVSEYTDKIDIYTYEQKSKRIMAQLREVCAILSGLALAADFRAGQQLLKDKEFKQYSHFFQEIFELGRRHKVRNPEKMRGAYGKLVYLLQDSQMPEIQELLEFSMVTPIHTVYQRLEQSDCLALLADPLLDLATANIIAEGKLRPQIDREIKTKERALEALARKYQSASLGYEEVRNCILSVGDSNTYLFFNRDPVVKMIDLLQAYFKPDSHEAGFSLAITAGQGGARLSHSHTHQFEYVLQSMTLWRHILHNMYKLWFMAEADLLDPANRYRLMDTGQGLNRVQNCPRVGRAMASILYQTQRELGSWVGSSVIHLGDRNVPNSLMFIDKYNQVSRILQPIVICIRRLDEIYKQPEIKLFIDSTFRDLDTCKKTILCDFFRHAFDGSGSDNFFEAGSCIDGRLTSAWNWCQNLDKKKTIYAVFLLTGFVGFDGDWN